MTAVETATRVAEWAVVASGPPPSGDLSQAEELMEPGPALVEALGRLAATTGARLRIDSPALGRSPHVGPAAGVMAAAIGAMGIPRLAEALLLELPLVYHPAEWLVRHGLAIAAHPYSSSQVLELLRAASPLTALLEHPPQGRKSAADKVADRLLSDVGGRRLLRLTLAEPTSEVAVRNWRASLLDRLRLDEEVGRPFVLDVYESALVFHSQEHLRQVAAARAVLSDALASQDDERLADAHSVAGYWGPLAALDRSNLELLRARRYLGYEYREGLALHLLSQRLRGVAA